MAWGVGSCAACLVWMCVYSRDVMYTNVLWARGAPEACTGVGRGGAQWCDAAMVGVSVCVCLQLGGCCCWRVVQCSLVAKRRLGRPSGGGSCTWNASRGSRHAVQCRRCRWAGTASAMGNNHAALVPAPPAGWLSHPWLSPQLSPCQSSPVQSIPGCVRPQCRQPPVPFRPIHMQQQGALLNSLQACRSGDMCLCQLLCFCTACVALQY